ncbi:MAG: hypothetical protein NC320_09125 [Clostridium sp.]|nr:hypothetical protein [Clostridium sp.]MCM1547911.1 hypothetical protein [Ruminococcus sp.]
MADFDFYERNLYNTPSGDRLNAFKTDFSQWYDWDEIDDSVSNTITFKKYYNKEDDSDKRWCGIRIASVGNIAFYSVGYDGDKEYYHQMGGGATSGYTPFMYGTAAVSKTRRGFLLVNGTSKNPTLDSDSATNYVHVIGIFQSTNSATGEKGICSFSINANSGRLICSKSTVNTSYSLSTSSNLGYHVTSQSGIVMTQPIVTAYSLEAPDDFLEMVYKPDTYQCCDMEVKYNGKNYRRLGYILVPI